MTRSFRPVPALVGVLVAAVLSTAGCTTTLPGAPAADPAPPSEGPGSDPVAWTDRVCNAVLAFARPATSAPDFAATADLAAIQGTFSDYLNTVLGGLQTGRDRLVTVGLAPYPAGDEAVARTDSAMQALERDFGEAKAAVDAADVDDPATFISTLTRIESTLSEMTTPNPVGEMAAAPQLQRAAERAENCRRLSTLASAAPR